MFAPGIIRTVKYYDDDGYITRLEHTWEGGPIISVTWALLHAADHKHLRFDGPRFLYGPYCLYLLRRRCDIEANDYVRTNWPFWRLLVLWYRIVGWIRKDIESFNPFN